MATAAEVVAAIDAHLAANLDRPLTLEVGGKRVTYEGRAELLALRREYAAQVASAAGGVGFGLTRIVLGGTR